MNGVDNMIYMYSISPSTGQMRLSVDFAVGTDPNTDQVLTQMRYLQAEPQLPVDVRNYGVTTRKATSAPLVLFSLYSPKGTYDALFLGNYAYINLGIIPLAIASGAGAQARQILGTAAMGGMLAASTIAIFLIPVSFYAVESLAQRRSAKSAQDNLS